jgi:hypothetical protein
MDRIKHQDANNKKQLSAKIVNKVDETLRELEASVLQQKNKAQVQLRIIEEEYEGDYANAKICFDSQDYIGLKRLFEVVKRQNSACFFKELISEIGRSELSAAPSEHAEKTPKNLKQTELQSFQQYQTMFEKMALDRLLARVMKEIPENAGPLNPERLVIRSFKALQEISPDYLSHLISYYESLLTLQLFSLTEK